MHQSYLPRVLFACGEILTRSVRSTLSMNVPYFLNTAWMAKCAAEAWAFRRATRNVAGAQAQVLAAILRQNAACEFGRRHGFAKITDPAAFRRQVPLARHEHFAADLERIAAGQKNILTCEPVTLLEPTSGTTAGEKLIPYTRSLRRQFQRGVSTWIADLFWNCPAIRTGRAYWSISPPLGRRRYSSGGIPIGFDDDAAYLGTLERRVLDRLLIAPAKLTQSSDMEAFRYQTLSAMLAADDLALISIWSPTFLTSLLEPLENWSERICHDLRQQGRGRRADELHAIVRSGGFLADRLRHIWPGLACISCWADAAASLAVPSLRQLFPHVFLQPKGLLATEGFVSLPLIGYSGAALALRSHFFEFQQVGNDSQRCLLAEDVEPGGRYRVILTTAGGLYRYELRDEIEIVGFIAQCPLLRFLGKADRIVDFVGEKLAETHVRAVLERVLVKYRMAVSFALLVPVLGPPLRYRLYFQRSDRDGDLSLADAQADLQQGLEENPYYRQAVRLGQLQVVELCELSPDAASGWNVYERRCRERGQKVGDIKPAVLDGWTGWPAAFAGEQ
jgi:hypothetical protein